MLFICLRQSSALSSRATSEGQMVLSLPRFVAKDKMVSEMLCMADWKWDCDDSEFRWVCRDFCAGRCKRDTAM